MCQWRAFSTRSLASFASRHRFLLSILLSLFVGIHGITPLLLDARSSFDHVQDRTAVLYR